MMQVALSFFMLAKRTPAALREVAAHAGWCVSEATMNRMVKSVRLEHQNKLRLQGASWLTSGAWDNLDFHLDVGTMTQANRATFESITTGLIFQLEHGVTREDLQRPNVTPPSGDFPTRRMPNRHNTPAPTIKDAIPSRDIRERVHDGMLWVISSILARKCAPALESEFGDIPSTLHIPIKKTTHHPVFAVHEKSSSNDGNIKVIRSLMEQIGVDEDVVRHVVMIVHGDLGVLERVKSILESRTIERTDFESMEYLETVPGLFHVLMACADAIWRTYLEPTDLRDEPQGVYQQFVKLNPTQTPKLKTNAPFRMLHDGIDHILSARILECARVALGLASVTELVASEFTRADIGRLALDIYARFVEGGATSQDDEDDGFGNDTAKDRAASNKRLFNRDALLYRVLALSIRFGAIGLVEDTLSVWIPIFKSTRKHKYTAHMLEFLTRLRALPPRLA